MDILKDVKEEESSQLKWGNQIHKAAAKRVSLGTPLPAGMDTLEWWCQRVLTGEGNILVEQQLAINKEFGSSEWFGKDTWYRSIADVLKIMGPVALALDWKTGKILDDPVQLALMAACIFAHFPDIHKIRTEFVWLKEGPGVSSREDFDRNAMATVWKGLWHRIQQLEHAYNTTTYPAKPGYLCRNYCPVKQCPHHGT